MKSTTSKIGRVVYAVPFVVFGLNHWVFGAKLAGIVPAWVPGGVFWVYLTGTALIAAGITIALGSRLTYWATAGLAALLGTFVLTLHLPGLFNPQMAQMAMISLLKDTSLLGAALAIGGTYAPHAAAGRDTTAPSLSKAA